MNMEFEAVSHTMQQSKDREYQISRADASVRGKFIYRAWLRKENLILLEIEAWDESGDRAAAVQECKLACLAHRGD